MTVRRLFRFALLLVHVVLGILLTAILAGILRRSADSPLYRKTARWWLGRIVRIVGGRVTVQGEPAAPGTLLVSNHVSWLDIPLLGSCTTVNFLSKSEVRDWPVLGWLADKSGTLFIERGKRDGAKAAADVMVGCLHAAGRVVVFPEGTTTDGVNMKPFHARLFAAAVESNAPVQPVAIRYLDPQGQPHRLVPYIDQQSLIDNLWGVLAEPWVGIEVHFLTPIPSRELPRKALAAYSEQQVRAALGLASLQPIGACPAGD